MSGLCKTIQKFNLRKIKSIRQRGYNRFEISRQLKKNDNIAISPSSAYRLMRKLGINQLNPIIKEEVRRIN